MRPNTVKGRMRSKSLLGVRYETLYISIAHTNAAYSKLSVSFNYGWWRRCSANTFFISNPFYFTRISRSCDISFPLL